MEFDFQTAALGVAALSLGLIGMIMAGSALWQEQAEKYKKLIPQTIIGLVIVTVASTLLGFFGGG